MSNLRVLAAALLLLPSLCGCYSSASSPPGGGGVAARQIKGLTEELQGVTQKLDALTQKVDAVDARLSQLSRQLAGQTPGGVPETEAAPGPERTVAATTSSQRAEVLAEAAAAARRYDELCEKYPDVPRVELLTEIEGVKIPRNTAKGVQFHLGGKIEADVGNAWVQEHPAAPANGGRVVIRFNAEPKSLNPLTETSAYSSYILEFTHDVLARRNKETLEYEPKLASQWVIEDSVKLAADYVGKERRIRLAGGEAAGMLEITAPEIENADNPPLLAFETLDREGQPLGNVWVGFFPLDPESMPGAPRTGLHRWSDAAGKLEVGGLVPGRYRVHVGAEVYGLTEAAADGRLTVRAGTPENPLTQELASANATSLVLKPEDYVDVQRETVYTYYIREEARWADGAPFTARDLEFGYYVLQNPLVDAESVRTYYADLIECRPLGPRVIRMVCRQQYFKSFEITYELAGVSPPWHLFEQRFREKGQELTLERLTPEEEQAQRKISVHGEAFAKFFNQDASYGDAPLGTGPYAVQEWRRKDSLTLRRRSDYWDTQHTGHLDEIVVKFIADDTTAFQELRAGSLDFLYRMTPEQYFDDYPNLPASLRDRYVQAEWFSPAYSYVGWNMLKPEFQDSRVRMALALLFDTQGWIDGKMHGGGVAISGSQYIFGPGYDHSVLPVGYDPKAAAQLLEDAGWIDSDGDGTLDRNGKPFRCQILIPSGSATVLDQMAVLQKSLKQVGIDATVQTLEWASYLERINNKDFDVCRMSWAMPPESDPFQLWHSSEAGINRRSSNHVSFRNPLADQLIEMLRVTLDEEKRQCINASFHRVLDREQPYLFLYTPKEYGVYRKQFRGVKWLPLRPGFDLRDWWLAKEDQ